MSTNLFKPSHLDRNTSGTGMPPVEVVGALLALMELTPSIQAELLNRLLAPRLWLTVGVENNTHIGMFLNDLAYLLSNDLTDATMTFNQLVFS